MEQINDSKGSYENWKQVWIKWFKKAYYRFIFRDTYEKADKIQFYEDKMFVLDTGGYLHIYEKEE